ncbi:MAG: 5-oxoprolinase subunit PxpA [Bacillota bacterium]
MDLILDLNSDLGESFGNYEMGHDDEIMDLISSANVACGFHASDPMVMRRTVRAAAERGVSIGAHTSYPDLVGFGRRRMDLTPEEIVNDLIYQVGALEMFCRVEGTRLNHVKAHGAIYNTAVKHEPTARGLIEGMKALDVDLYFYLPAGTEFLERARAEGLKVVAEAFADRLYDDEGNLVSRRVPGSVFEDPKRAAGQAESIALKGQVTTQSGKVIPMEAQSICVHGDSRKSLEISRTVQERLVQAGVTIKAPGW